MPEATQGKSLVDLLYVLLVQTGVGWAMMGAMLAVMFGGIGSAQGIRIAAAQGTGVMSEKPELFGRVLILIALPGTQGFYGFITAVLMAVQVNLLKGPVTVTPLVGLSLLAIGFGAGIVYWRSAVFQGETSAAAISMVAKRPDQAGRSILFPALVETYAVVALLAAILLIFWLTGEDLVLPTTIPG